MFVRATQPVIRRSVVAFLLFCGLPKASGAQQAVSSGLRRQAVRADDGHELTVWRKRSRAHARGAILLLHGRTWSSLPNFDLHVKDQRVSLMDAFVARGYTVYALDQRGYGGTPRDSSQWLTPARAESDTREVLEWIAAHEKTGRPALLGYSQGSRTAMLVAQHAPTTISALVLYGFPMDVSDESRARLSAMPDPAQLERRATTVAAAEEDFITPASTPPGVKDAYGRAAVAADPVRSDWRGERAFAAIDPSLLHTPVLLINGERDPYASRANLPAFMAKVTGVDRSWIVLAHADHAAHLERQQSFVDAVIAFLEQARAR